MNESRRMNMRRRWKFGHRDHQGHFNGKISMKEKVPPRSYKSSSKATEQRFVRGEGALTCRMKPADQNG